MRAAIGGVCVVAGAWMLASCGGETATPSASQPASAGGDAAASASFPTSTPPKTDTPSPSASAAPTQPPDGPAAPAAKLAVDGEGLRFFSSTNGSASPVGFGRPQAEVLAVLEGVRGAAGRGVNADCGAGPVDYANWADGLSLVFQQGKFVGWGLDGRATGAIGTASGIGPGSTRAELDDAYGDVTVTKTSLGEEFAGGGIQGVLDGPDAQAKITDLWAGVSCVAR